MFVEITNEPRDYAWGSTTAIAELLGTQPSGAPQAELWLGAHPGSPARVVGAPGEERTLLDLVEGRLPFLLKVLAAAAPLSLQAHPTPEQAEEGFARENAAGVPLDAYLDLVRATVDNVADLGPRDALTGPVSRGDHATVQRHLEAIDPSEHAAYEAMADAARRLIEDEA